MNTDEFRILFSDLDGTLVHYPKHFQDYATATPSPTDPTLATLTYTATQTSRPCTTLPSLTAGPSYISHATARLLSKLRALGVVVVFITAARTSTYLSRRQHLPEADAECFESGGRILLAANPVVPTNRPERRVAAGDGWGRAADVDVALVKSFSDA
eukprot:CAMPEP_0174888604 /NCGR_PEP_ID=MMETSP0167-20121228/3879_1 /TAXON_ID=38298 /ORGANISM="Rhodella maculata, Strain CCMP736" /LENGTH=156 /DNA_ID=CAMNT_0016125657 /DNA_START=124 /DNA_END=591 /DNA_ORIENTATION=-